MYRKQLLTISIAMLVVLSGCLGFGGGGAVSDGAESTPGSSGDGSVDDSAGGSDGAEDRSSGGSSDFERAEQFEDIRNERQMADYIDRSPFPVYRPGEYFRYEGTSTFGSESGELEPASMTIQSGAGGEWLEADIEVTLVRGEESVTFTEEDPGIIFTPELSLTTNGRSWVWLYRYNYVTNIDPRISELSVGDTWNFVSESGSDEEDTELIFTVTGAETYAGVDCVVVETEFVEGSERRTWNEACVAPDVGLPLYSVHYDNDGSVAYELELVEYRR